MCYDQYGRRNAKRAVLEGRRLPGGRLVYIERGKQSVRKGRDGQRPYIRRRRTPIQFQRPYIRRRRTPVQFQRPYIRRRRTPIQFQRPYIRRRCTPIQFHTIIYLISQCPKYQNSENKYVTVT